MTDILSVETTTKCNLDCIMCPRKSFSDSERTMDEDTFQNVLAVFRTVPISYAYLNGYGEPLLDKDIFARAEAIHNASPSTDIGFSTNGLLLHEENIRKFQDSCLAGLTVSMDAGTRESYAAIRGRDAFEQLLRNMRALCESNNGKALSVNAVITRKNLGEMEEILLRCLEVGMPALNFVPIYVYSTTEQLDLFVEKSLITAEYLRLAEKYRGRISLTAWNLEHEKKYGSCWGNIPRILDIDCDGNVYPCCVHRSHAPRHGTDGSREEGHVRLGSINEDPFEAIAGQAALQRMLTSFEHGDIPAECKNCFLARAFDKSELVKDAQKLQEDLKRLENALSRTETALHARLAETTGALAAVRRSRSWRYTAPLRSLAATLHKLRGR